MITLKFRNHPSDLLCTRQIIVKSNAKEIRNEDGQGTKMLTE